MSVQETELASESAVVAAFDRRQTLAKADPLLALALFVEAAGDRRASCDEDASSLLQTLRNAARRAVTAHRGGPFHNELYP